MSSHNQAVRLTRSHFVFDHEFPAGLEGKVRAEDLGRKDVPVRFPGTPTVLLLLVSREDLEAA